MEIIKKRLEYNKGIFETSMDGSEKFDNEEDFEEASDVAIMHASYARLMDFKFFIHESFNRINTYSIKDNVIVTNEIIKQEEK